MSALSPYNLGALLLFVLTSVGYQMIDVSLLFPPPKHLRVRELSEENVKKVKEELKAKQDVGARLEIVCVVPPVSLA